MTSPKPKFSLNQSIVINAPYSSFHSLSGTIVDRLPVSAWQMDWRVALINQYTNETQYVNFREDELLPSLEQQLKDKISSLFSSHPISLILFELSQLSYDKAQSFAQSQPQEMENATNSALAWTELAQKLEQLVKLKAKTL